MTARMNPKVKTAIASIGDDAWTPIKYPHAVWEDTSTDTSAETGIAGSGYWVSDAEVAEVPFTAFTSRKKTERITCRLVVRRVKRHQRLASDGTAQGELFATYRHHAFVTNSTLTTLTVGRGRRPAPRPRRHRAGHRADHRRTQSRAARAPAVGVQDRERRLAGPRDHGVQPRPRHRRTRRAKTRWATIRTQLINIPGRVATSGRRTTLHLPRGWPWAHDWEHLHTQTRDLLAATLTGGPPHPAAA